MKVKSNKEVYFHQALGVLSKVPPFNRCTNGELEILAELMRLKMDGWKPLINSEVRETIIKKLGMSKQTLKNFLVSMRKKEIIIGDEVNPRIMLKYLQPISFEFYEEE